MYKGRRVKYPLFLPGLKKLKFSRYSNNPQISNFMQICPVIAELLRSDGRKETDMAKLIVTFCNFANVTKDVNT